MSLMKCNQCNGLKTHSPLGFVQVECLSCKGIGFIERATHAGHPPIDSLPLIECNDDQTLDIKKKRKKKIKPIYHVDHPLNRLKEKLANVNT
jgi:hypothetical protein